MKNFLPFLLTVLAICSISHTHGQEERLHYTVAYFGNNIWNEGLKVSAQWLKSSDTTSNKKGETRMIERSYAADLGFYNDSRSHAGVFLNAGWERKKVFPNRVYTVSSLNPAGIFRSFLPETYEVDEAGEITQVSLPGRFYFAPAASWGIGRKNKKNPNRGWYTKAYVMVLMPYNTYLMPLLNWEVGYTFTL